MKTFNIAVIAGDGIGKEVVPEGIRVLEAAGRRFGVSIFACIGTRLTGAAKRTCRREK